MFRPKPFNRPSFNFPEVCPFLLHKLSALRALMVMFSFRVKFRRFVPFPAAFFASCGVRLFSPVFPAARGITLGLFLALVVLITDGIDIDIYSSSFFFSPMIASSVPGFSLPAALVLPFFLRLPSADEIFPLLYRFIGMGKRAAFFPTFLW